MATPVTVVLVSAPFPSSVEISFEMVTALIDLELSPDWGRQSVGG